jgi:hypothetical protein
MAHITRNILSHFAPSIAPIKPFKMTYHTDNTENEVTANGPTLPLNAIADTGNVGFCLDFQER